MDSLEQNIRQIQNEIKGKGVTLLAATKTVPAERINRAIDLGIKDIGENRVQELLDKYDYINKDGTNIHFIGRLQSNKVKYIIDKVCLIHSLDSLKLAKEIQKRAQAIGKIQNVLVEVNIAGESSKTGIMPQDVDDFLRSVSAFPNLKVQGLMCIPPVSSYEGQNIQYFKEIKQMQVDITAKKIDNISMNILSMGMSADYLQAIEYGATIIRIGSKIFGKRNYNTEELK